MKIAVVHNRYRERGGEDVVADAEVALLRRHGHAVVEYRRHNDELDGITAPAAAAPAVWSRRTLRELAALLAAERPDIVHLHNSWPLVSPSVCAAAARAGVPLVATLHNYRHFCAQAMLLRDGKPCEDCLGRAPWPALRHACYRGSRAQTAVLVSAMLVHRALGTWQRGVARWIALSAFSRAKFVEAGWPAERIAVLPNFAEDPGPCGDAPRNGLLYVGRLAPEKGLAVLADALRLAPEVRLDVIGDGPEAWRFDGLPNVCRRGALAPAAVREAMQRALALVLPSLWHEHSPRVVAEAMACGLPVLASRIGALAEMVDDGETGWLVAPGDAQTLAAAMRVVAATPQAASQRGQAAREVYRARHDPRAHHDALLAIYRAACTDKVPAAP